MQVREEIRYRSVNFDDHLKYQGFPCEPRTRDIYQLSPVYDVVPQEGSSKHMLRIGIQGRERTLTNALSEVAHIGMREPVTRAIADKVLEVVSRRADYYVRRHTT